jgi:hypothetical protein
MHYTLYFDYFCEKLANFEEIFIANYLLVDLIITTLYQLVLTLFNLLLLNLNA